MKTIISENVFATVVRATNKLADFIKPTYGPAENKIIIGKPFGTMVLDDGVAAAREFELEDVAENEVVKVVKEVAVRTNNRVGDGTTGAIIMAQAIIKEIAEFGKIDGKKIVTELKKASAEFKEKILKKAKKISTKEELKKVAMVSFGNEPIAKIIANLLHKVGFNGVITLEESQAPETTVEMTDGIGIDKGFLSQYMVTNPQRQEAVLNNPYIIVTDYRLTGPQDCISIMEKCLAAGKRDLLVVAEHTEGDALATFVVNKIEGKFNALVIDAPQFGLNRDEFLRDLAMLTGATVISEENGIKFSDITMEMLGTCEKVVSKIDKTVVVGGNARKKELKETIAFLKDKIANGPVEWREGYKHRLGRLQNGIAVIKVGANTESEAKALKYKVEDAVNATKVAFKSGVVRGAGIALSEIETSSQILNNALKYPHRQLLENTGMKKGDIGKEIVDPVEVLIAGVESAVSIASLLVTTKGIMVDVPEKKD